MILNETILGTYYVSMAIGNKTEISDSIPDKMKFHCEDKNTKVTQGKMKGKIVNTVQFNNIYF